MITFFTFAETDTEEDDYDYVTNLYNNYGKTMYKYAYKLSKNNDISNDIVSIAFVTIIEKIELIRKIHSYKIKSYLMRIVKNTFINYMKREKKNVNYDDIKEYIAFSNSDNISDNYNYSLVEDALYHMPEPYKSILEYRYIYEELTYEEIAKLLNINVKSIRVYKQRAIEMLKERLKGQENTYENK